MLVPLLLFCPVEGRGKGRGGVYTNSPTTGVNWNLCKKCTDAIVNRSNSNDDKDKWVTVTLSFLSFFHSFILSFTHTSFLPSLSAGVSFMPQKRRGCDSLFFLSFFHSHFLSPISFSRCFIFMAPLSKLGSHNKTQLLDMIQRTNYSARDCSIFASLSLLHNKCKVFSIDHFNKTNRSDCSTNSLASLQSVPLFFSRSGLCPPFPIFDF